jgi:uncharacterized protein (TIGR03000 family)
MTLPVSIGGHILAALAASVLLAGTAQAQSTGSSYPYWATAPESYRGSRLRVPVPGMSPNTISNAAHSSSADPDRSIYPGDLGSGIGGAYVPPFLTSSKLGSRLTRGGETAADDKARIWMRVPENAQIWVEGVKTKQTGELRYFFSPPLTPGKRYSYRVRLRWTKNGKVMEENQRLIVSAGSRILRDFRPARPKLSPDVPQLEESPRPSARK